MCSNTFVDKLYPLHGIILFALCSVFTSSLPLLQPYTITYTSKVLPHLPLHTPFHYAFVIIPSLHPSFATPFLPRLLLYYMRTRHTQHTKIYVPTVVVFIRSLASLVGYGVMCGVSMRTKRQGYAFRHRPRGPPLRPCALARRKPGGPESPRPPCHDRQSRPSRYRC